MQRRVNEFAISHGSSRWTMILILILELARFQARTDDMTICQSQAHTASHVHTATLIVN